MMPSATGTPANIGFPVFDADGHVAEPRTLWDEYCDPALRKQANEALFVHDFEQGGSGLMLDGRCIVPGVEAVTFAGQNPADFLGKHWGDGYPGAFDPAHRLRDMDLEGIDLAMIFPSAVGAIGGVSDFATAAAMARAYNRWMLDYCATDPARLYPVAVVPLQDPAAAVAEVEWAADRGFRCVMVRASRYQGRAHDHSDFERFYAACDHHDLAIGLHPFPFPDVDWSQSILPDLAGAPGSHILMADMLSLPLDNMLTMAYVMFGGICDRHPQLPFAFLESNATWTASLIDRMEARFDRGNFPLIKTPPSEILARQCFVSVEGDEKSLPPLVDLIGEDVLIWASDFPHFDGHFPGAVSEAVEGMEALPERVQRKVLGENATRLFKIPLEPRVRNAPIA
ncbi:MAG: amidohydrolase family protein [Myxococcales bacterium]|nr:amidohydrolase family protein [Myxococcales bacterium]